MDNPTKEQFLKKIKKLNNIILIRKAYNIQIITFIISFIIFSYYLILRKCNFLYF